MAKLTALDLETTGLDHRTDKIKFAALYSLESNGTTSKRIVENIQELEDLKGNALILHNSKFDLKFLHMRGIYPHKNNVIYDTMLMHHLIDENAPHDLDSIIKAEYGDNYKEKFWEKHDAGLAVQADWYEYGLKDVEYTHKLFMKFYNALKQANKLKLFEDISRFNIQLFLTEIEGVNLNIPYIQKFKHTLTQEISDIQKLAYASASEEIAVWEMREWQKEIEKRKTDKGKMSVLRPKFNLSSSKQIGDLLYDIVGAPIQTNKTGGRTVDDNALSLLTEHHAIVGHIRSLREKEKILGTYVEGILDKQVNGVIYPEFNINGTVTGRISHKNPNMGNIPADNAIRAFFVPKEGHVFLCADYDQLEICLAAHFSNDQVLIDLISNKQSMHDYTAKALNLERAKAKTLNFSVIYGAGEYKIAQTLGCSVTEAADILKKLWKTYAGLGRIIKECHEKVEQGIPIVNPFGRTRTFSVDVNDFKALQRAKRQAFNSLVQGTGADLTNLSFTKVSELLRKLNYGRGLFNVHDENIVEVKKETCKESSLMLTSTMEGMGPLIELKVPLTVKCSEPLPCWQK